MTALQITAVLKTDIRGSTPTFRGLPESDLSLLLTSHREFITRIASARDGHIVKPEGDGFWIAFPSVTAAALAAIDMQEELQLAQPNKGDDRLAMRIVITLGDVLSPEGALIGDAVVLAARIEALTPPDEIYLSAAARLAVNQAEVRTVLVDSFAFKGFSEPVAVYRVEQRHRTQVLKNQYIVVTDLRGFLSSAQSSASPISTVERTFDRLFELVADVCREFTGTSRFSAGDSCCLTFPEAGLALAAAERLAEEWAAFERETMGCGINVIVHKGTLFAYRSVLYSSDLSVAMAAEQATHNGEPAGLSVFITGEVHRDLVGTPWPARLKRADIQSRNRELANIAFYHLESRDYGP
jgi:class 3 adenylate cyclase